MLDTQRGAGASAFVGFNDDNSDCCASSLRV
jgi:hypothetical protein